MKNLIQNLIRINICNIQKKSLVMEVRQSVYCSMTWL